MHVTPFLAFSYSDNLSLAKKKPNANTDTNGFVSLTIPTPLGIG
jgi:hypothetical protein